MADVLTQIQQSQARARDQQLAGAQRDVSWDSTFGRMAPDNVLRETRNMTALIANAVEKKMQLAAQTDAEAQRIYINDQKWKAEQAMQPLKDDRLKAQIRADEARARATTAQERLATSRLEREARAVEHTASAQWELDQLESSSLPDAEKRAWLNTVRGKYPSMDKEATARYDSIYGAFNPDTAASEEKIRLAGETTRAREKVKQEFATPPKTDAERIAFEVERKKALDATKPATPEKDKSIPTAITTQYAKSLGELSMLNQQIAAEKDQVKKDEMITKRIGHEEIVRSLESQTPNLRATRGLPGETKPAPAATAHPMEGQVVKQKSTGQTGRIVNGQFVAQ